MSATQRWRAAAVPAVLLAAALIVALPGAAQDQDPKGSDQKAKDAATATEQQATGGQPSSQSEQQKQQPPALGSAQQTPPKGSLAAAAARIHLRRPEQEEGGAVVISNGNLDQVAAGGTVSEARGVSTGGGATAPKTAADKGDGEEAEVNPASVLVGQYLEQKRTVEGLEARLKNFDEQLAKAPRDPYNAQSENSPQNRPPGVVDQAQKKRDDLAKELADERAKLDALRAKARRDGVELDNAKKEAAPASAQ